MLLHLIQFNSLLWVFLLFDLLDAQFDNIFHTDERIKQHSCVYNGKHRSVSLKRAGAEKKSVMRSFKVGESFNLQKK